MSFADDIRNNYRPKSQDPLPSLDTIAEAFYKDVKEELMRNARSGRTTEMNTAMGFKRIRVVTALRSCYVHWNQRVWYPASDSGGNSLTVCNKAEQRKFVSIIRRKCRDDGIHIDIERDLLDSDFSAELRMHFRIEV